MKMLNNYFQSHIKLLYKKIKEVQGCGSKHFLSWKVLNWSTVKTWCVAAVSTHLREQQRGNSNFDDPWWQLEVERVKTCENIVHFLVNRCKSFTHLKGKRGYMLLIDCCHSAKYFIVDVFLVFMLLSVIIVFLSVILLSYWKVSTEIAVINKVDVTPLCFWKRWSPFASEISLLTNTGIWPWTDWAALEKHQIFLADGWLSYMHIRKLPLHPHLFIYFVNSTSKLSASTPSWSSVSSSLENFLGIISLWKDLLCPL